MTEIIITGIVAILIFIVVMKFLQRAFGLHLFNPDPYRNPFRRYCKKCGQCQEQIEERGRPEYYHYWTDMGAIKDEKCKCHKYQEYRN